MPSEARRVAGGKGVRKCDSVHIVGVQTPCKAQRRQSPWSAWLPGKCDSEQQTTGQGEGSWPQQLNPLAGRWGASACEASDNGPLKGCPLELLPK